MKSTLHGYALPVLLLGGLSLFGARLLIGESGGEGDESLPRAPRWSGDGSYIGGGPALDSGYKNWDLCALGGRVESLPPHLSMARWGPAAITGASGCGCSGAASYNGDPKTAGLGLALAPPHDVLGDPGQLPPSPTDHPFVMADTGEVVYTETDFVIKGTGFDFVFTRTYRSALDFEGWLGYGWAHSAELALIHDTNGDAKVYLGDGRISDWYDWDSVSGTYSSPDGHYDLLEIGTRGAGYTPAKYASQTYFKKTEKNGVVWEFDLGKDGAGIDTVRCNESRGFRVSCGSHADWTHVESPAVEVDGVTEALTVAESAGLPLDRLDLRVDRLGTGVRHAVHDRIQDTFQVLADHPRHPAHRLQPAA